MTGEPGVPRRPRGRRPTRTGRALEPASQRLARADIPERLQEVLDRAEAVIGETRRVIRILLRDLERQRAATRPVLTGQPRVRRRRRRAGRGARGQRP